MAHRIALAEDAPFAMQINSLADEELLDFWEETQQIEGFLRQEYNQAVVPAQDYERLIVLELQLRSCARSVARGF